jgi:hypothetical protein
MPAFTPFERKIWKKYIVNKILLTVTRNYPSVFRFMVIIEDGYPTYFVYKEKPSELINILRRNRNKRRGWICLCEKKDDIEMYRKIKANFGLDPKFPSINIEEIEDYHVALEIFEEGIEIVKRKLSFLRNVYLKSKYLPKELVAHIFSFIRKCEIEKNKKSLPSKDVRNQFP